MQYLIDLNSHLEPLYNLPQQKSIISYLIRLAVSESDDCFNVVSLLIK